MKKKALIADLMANYATYSDAGELSLNAASAAPATTLVCVSVVSLESSPGCAASASAAVSAAGGATYEHGC